MFAGIDSTIERFSSTIVSYLFDVATLYVYSPCTCTCTCTPLKLVMQGFDGLFLVTVR